MWQPMGWLKEERVALMNFGPDGLLPELEGRLMLQVITLQQKALAFTPEEQGLLKWEIANPYLIPMVSHKPWQINPIPIPNLVWDQFTELIMERLRMGLYYQST